MIPLEIEKIAAFCGGTLYGPAGLVRGVTTDSRKVKEGDLFVALKGEKADGHAYLPQVFAAGAACALVERLPAELPENTALILVEDTALAIQQAAELYRSGFDLPIVGITGSVGKTTMKEMCAAVLARRFCTHKTQGNFNNNLGLPLTLFGLEKAHQAAVSEMGISHFGEMELLSRSARPNLVLMTNIGSSHLEFLGDRAGVLRAKSEIFRYADPAGCAILNGDDEYLKNLRPNMAKILYYGLGENCNVRAENVRSVGTEYVDCDILFEGRRVHARIPGFGEHLVYAALGAAAVGFSLGMTEAEIAAGIADYAPAGRRARVAKTDFVTVIDDCYNANPASAAAALRSLAALEGRRVAVLGDMLELGENSPALHRETGELAAELGLDAILCVGPLSAETARGAGEKARHFADKAALCAALPALIGKGDQVLVKASRGMALETVVDALLDLK